MALKDPAYANITTMAQYANELAYLKKQYNQGNTEWAKSQAEKLRWQAFLQGIDLKVMEREAVIKMGGDPNAIDWDYFERTTYAPFRYAETIANLKKFVGQGYDMEKQKELAQKARLDAALQGIDLVLLERRAETLADPNHNEPSDEEIEKAKRWYIDIAQYAARLYNNAKEWDRIDKDTTLPESEKERLKNLVHQESQNIRAEALRKGINLWDIEKLYMPYVTGHPWTNQDYETAKKYIDPLYKAAGIDPSGVQVPNRALPSSGKFTYYNNPVVKRTMFGETYSGADMVVYLAFPGYKPIEVGTATTVTVTTYREKKQFRAIGYIAARGITKGPRTISGKIIFTVIKEHIVEALRDEIPYLREHKKILMDELPSFDILISCGNEYGGAATMVINGVTVVDEQKTLSIEELFTETIFTYIARDYQPLRATKKVGFEPYDPQDWFSYKFREAGSEMIGKFQIDELLLSENAKELAASLPSIRQNPFYENNTDVVQAIMQNIPTLEQQATQSPPIVRKIMVQAFSKKTGAPLGVGKIKINFGSTYGAFEGLNLYDMRGKNLKDPVFDFTLAKPVQGTQFFYGLVANPKSPIPAGTKFNISYSGYPDMFLKPASATAVVADGEYTYVRLDVDQGEDTVLRLYNVEDNPFITSYWESERNIRKLPDLNQLQSYNFKKEVYGSKDGLDWISMKVERAGQPVKGVKIQLAWEMIRGFMPGGNDQFARLERIDPKAYKSTVTLQYYTGKPNFYITTNDYGNAAIHVRDLVYWKGVKKDSSGKYEKIRFADLPDDVIVKIYAVMDKGNGQKGYITWMLYKKDPNER